MWNVAWYLTLTFISFHDQIITLSQPVPLKESRGTKTRSKSLSDRNLRIQINYVEIMKVLQSALMKIIPGCFILGASMEVCKFVVSSNSIKKYCWCLIRNLLPTLNIVAIYDKYGLLYCCYKKSWGEKVSKGARVWAQESEAGGAPDWYSNCLKYYSKRLIILLNERTHFNLQSMIAWLSTKNFRIIEPCCDKLTILLRIERKITKIDCLLPRSAVYTTLSVQSFAVRFEYSTISSDSINLIKYLQSFIDDELSVLRISEVVHRKK